MSELFVNKIAHPFALIFQVKDNDFFFLNMHTVYTFIDKLIKIFKLCLTLCSFKSSFPRLFFFQKLMIYMYMPHFTNSVSNYFFIKIVLFDKSLHSNVYFCGKKTYRFAVNNCICFNRLAVKCTHTIILKTYKHSNKSNNLRLPVLHCLISK